MATEAMPQPKALGKLCKTPQVVCYIQWQTLLDVKDSDLPLISMFAILGLMYFLKVLKRKPDFQCLFE